MDQKPQPRKRRETCWWEPTYDPSLVGAMETGDWAFSTGSDQRKSHFSGKDLVTLIEVTRNRVFRHRRFFDCDFQDNFKYSAQIVFDNCEFHNCDLSLTTWIDVKFSNCIFNRVSFGQSTFIDCEFRSCEWHNMGLSPNGTKLESTYISNSESFINSAATNLDPSVLEKNGTDASEQLSKLESTKATLARRILKMLQNEGDEIAFYEAVKTFQIQHAKFRVSDFQHKSKKNGIGKCEKAKLKFWAMTWSIEKNILKAFGYMNDWGASVVKPIYLSIANMMVFFGIYCIIPSSLENSESPLQRSFDISILAGYTNYGSEKFSIALLAQNIQILLSIILYSITFATVLNRLSRVR